MNICPWSPCETFNLTLPLDMEDMGDAERLMAMHRRARLLQHQNRWLCVMVLLSVTVAITATVQVWTVGFQNHTGVAQQQRTVDEALGHYLPMDNQPVQGHTGSKPARLDLMETEDRANMMSGEQDDAYVELEKWVLRNGGTIDGVEGRVAFAGGGRGLYATKDIGVHERVLEIPAHLWLSGRNAWVSSPVGHILVSDQKVSKFLGENEGETWPLVLQVEFEMYNPYSFWKPYTDMIPKPASVIRFSSEEIDQIGSDTIKAHRDSNQKRCREVYDEIMVHLIDTYPRMFSHEHNTFESFLATSVTAWSRTFTDNLVPMADLLNHVAGTPDYPNHDTQYTVAGDTSQSDVKNFKDEKGWRCADWQGYNCFRATKDEGLTAKGQAALIQSCPKSCKACSAGTDTKSLVLSANANSFTLKAPQQKKVNEEVVISYGNERSSMSWLIWGGFIPDETKFGDYYCMQWGQKHVTFVDANGRVDDKFVTAVARSGANGAVLKTQQDVREWILRQVKEKLDSFPTTLEEDEATLGDESGVAFKLHVILQARIRIKSMLRNTIDHLRRIADTGSDKEKLRYPLTLVLKRFPGGSRPSRKWRTEAKRKKDALITLSLTLPPAAPG